VAADRRATALQDRLTSAVHGDVVPGERRRSGMTRRLALSVLAILSFQFAVLGLVQAWRDSLTLDEGVYLTAGVTALERHDLRMNPEQPPLAKVLSAVPVLLADPVVPDSDAWDENRWFDYTDEFIRAQDAAGKLHRVVFLNRFVPLAMTIATGLLAYAIAARLWGRLPGLLAATAWLTTPFALGLGHLNATDVGFALTTLAATFLLVRYLDAPRDGTAAFVGVGAGLMLLTRHAGLALAAGLVVAVVIAGRATPRAAARHALLVVVVGLGVLWAGYRVIAPSTPGDRANETLEGIISEAEDRSDVARVLIALPAPFEFRAGIAHLSLTGEERPGYLLGRSWTGGQWWYWPADLAVKLPPSVLALATLAVGGLIAARRRSRDRVLLAVMLPAALLATAVAVQPRTIGLRYLFPVLALGAVACAGAIVTFRRRWGPWLVGAIAVVQLASLWTAHPHALAWTSPFFRPAYRQASDSDVDWAQDVDRLADWAADDRERRPLVALTLPRGVDIGTIPGARRLREADPAEIRGWVAVGATPLTTLARDQLGWLRAYCPVDTIGGSILLYYFDEPPDQSPGPVMPAAPCNGGRTVSTRR